METTKFSKEEIIRKVAGLLANAESFNEQGNEEAASAYIQKAHALQMKYSIDQAMIDARNGEQTEQIISKTIPMPGKWGKRKVNLAHVIANNTNCTGYFKTGYPRIFQGTEHERTNYDSPKVYYYVVFGFESDVDHVEFMIGSLSRQMDAALNAASKLNFRDHGKTFGASFCNGFISAIGARLRAAYRESQNEAENEVAMNGSGSAGAYSVSLVLASKKQKVEEEMKAKVGRLKGGSASTTNSYSAFSAGKDAGNRATIAKGAVSGGTKGSLGR